MAWASKEGGRGGRVAPVGIMGDVLPKISFLHYFYLNRKKNSFSQDFQNKVAEIRGEIKFWG